MNNNLERNIEKVYNVIADIIRFLIDSNISVPRLNALDISCENVVCEKTINTSDIKAINSLIEELKSGRDFKALISILIKLDEYANNLLNLQLEDSFSKCISVTGVNSKESQKRTHVLVLYKAECSWEGIAGLSKHRDDIRDSLRYCTYVDMNRQDNNKMYSCIQHILEPSVFGLSSSEEGIRKLFIGLSHVCKNHKITLRKKSLLDKDVGQYVNLFFVDSMKNTSEIDVKARICKAIKEADKRGVEILVFPELLGTKQMVDSILEELKHNPIAIKIIVFPSIWECHNSDLGRNHCIISDGGGHVICDQDKMIPFIHKDEGKDYLEAIPEESIIHLMSIRGIGNISVAICRGALDSRFRSFLVEELGVRLLLCPSWTTRSREFSKSIRACEEGNCNVAWCNTCSALGNPPKGEKKDRIVGIISHFNYLNQEPYDTLKYYDHKESEECRECDNHELMRKACLCFDKFVGYDDYCEGITDD